jgi:hypothetical protein
MHENSFQICSSVRRAECYNENNIGNLQHVQYEKTDSDKLPPSANEFVQAAAFAQSTLISSALYLFKSKTKLETQSSKCLSTKALYSYKTKTLVSVISQYIL